MLFGNVAEVLTEEIIQHGQILHDTLIPKAMTKLTRNVKGCLQCINYTTQSIVSLAVTLVGIK